MAKVSVGLRGWRFEESDIFTADGEVKPLDEIPEDPRARLLRLQSLVAEPCDACYLVHGEAEKRRCNEATIVYGEPLEEVLLCADHEADFLYWFREAGGDAFAGEDRFRDEFHEWFADGGRAPAEYGGLDHVDTDPETLPELPSQREVQRRLEENAEGFERERYDLLELYEAGAPDDADAENGEDGEDDGENEDLDLDGLDLDTEYPRG